MRIGGEVIYVPKCSINGIVQSGNHSREGYSLEPSLRIISISVLVRRLKGMHEEHQSQESAKKTFLTL
jgi:hypothetical protein